jgi:large-conductance mechanosensitive channel
MLIPMKSLPVGVDLTESFKFTFSAGITEVAVKMGVQSDVIAIDFNVIAIIIFVWLDKLNKRMKSEQEIRMDTRFL